jgi:tol-pal system protein YbgF
LPSCPNKKNRMRLINIIKKIFLSLVFASFIITASVAEEEDEKINAITDQIQIIAQDLKTLEKAVYKKSDITGSVSSNNLNEDVLTKHLLKLNEIEEQFRNITNKFEEINFKVDKLSNRITKIQSDNQLRFTDLETNTSNPILNKKQNNKKTSLPGTDKAQDFGAAPAYTTTNLPAKQETQSIESASTVITEKAEMNSSLLPDKPAKDQYDFALSFMKIGDYETAEFALKEFINKNKTHDLAGNAQYWYGETFRVRQLYSDAATAYLDGYQNYPKSTKAPENLLKLGITLVQLGEKDQGCTMITGLKKQYPKANKSVLQKAQYEEKKFKCVKA